MELVLVLHNIRSTYNVGSILRTADGFGVSQIIYSGYTPTPDPLSTLLPHLSQKITEQIHKTALGAEHSIASLATSDLKLTLGEYKKAGFQVLGLENNLQSQTTHLLTESHLSSLFKQKVVILLGEEVSGISSELFPLIDLFLEIPMYGQKESFNVSIATAILLFYLRCQVQ